MKKSAEYFLDELRLVAEMRDGEDSNYSLHECYTELYRVFNEALMYLTSDKRLDFSGAFARFTYIAQSTAMPAALTRRVNAFRSRVKTRSYEQGGIMMFTADWKTVEEFLCRAFGVEREFADSSAEETEDNAESAEQTDANYMRVSVLSWDAYYIYAVADDEGGETMKVCYNNDTNFLGNWQYVASLLSKGDQLNLVNPYLKDGICYPELIIYQPDYLIDISAVAECFQPFGATAYYFLLKKFAPSEPSKHKLLGNFASQMLDEELWYNSQEGGKRRTYKESVADFFSRYSLQIVACGDDMSGFHEEAQRQQRNIREIMHTAFTEDKFIDAEKILLEPSFFCEMLGVQGRMDLMQSDYRVLMEQKSGKKDYNTNGHVEKHYCQMLLYLALLHYGFKLRNEDISCFLLYSKYPDGLIKETPAPRLLFEILRVRNQIAWMEFHCSRGGGRLLEHLTIDKINVLRRDDNFTRTYLLPPIEDLLRTIQMASPLERAYFLRMFTFVQREHVLSKIGNSQKEASGLSALWNSTLEEKRQAGNIFYNLRIISTTRDEVELLTTADDGDYLPNFRVGDVVVLYKYKRDTLPDVRRGMVFRASIAAITTDTLLLQLRAPQSNPIVFRQDDDTMWAVEHDFIESSYSSIYRSLYAFLEADKERRDLLLCQRPPTVDDYSLLIGPPGTGKTSYGLMRQLREELKHESNSVLLLSYTNRAVDEICSKLLKDGLDFIRIGSRLSCPEEYKPYLLENKVAGCENIHVIRRMLLSARIVVGTTTSITAHQEILTMRPFSLAIIDEASQILEPHLLGIMSAKCGEKSSIRRFYFIGDHKQLPAVVQQSDEESKVDQPLLNRIGLTNCRNSLFERLLRISPPELIERFTRQGRMHRDVAQFACDHFYEGNLNTIPLPHQEQPLSYTYYNNKGDEILRLVATHRIAFVNVEQPVHSTSAKVNQSEAELIADVVVAVYNLYRESGREFSATQSVGVIVPYRNQIATVRRSIEQRVGKELLSDITIDTVERYQGSERDVIVYGFTVQREYQLDFLTNNCFEENGFIIDRKLNVALTRAREQMILIGNKQLLSQNALFRSLIEQTEVTLKQ